LTRTPAQREELAKQIPAGLAAIYRYWLPYRKAVHERMLAATYQRAHPKGAATIRAPAAAARSSRSAAALRRGCIDARANGAEDASFGQQETS